jgi:putative ABC transport system substrate-binding protein
VADAAKFIVIGELGHASGRRRYLCDSPHGPGVNSLTGNGEGLPMKQILSAACGFAAIMAVSAGQNAWAADIGVTWQGESGMTNRVMTGFQERMAEIAPDVGLDIRGPLEDEAALQATVEEFDSSMDAMVVLRSNGSRFLSSHPTSIPTFIGGGNHPPSLGVVDNMEAPQGNVTGVTYFIPHEVPMQSYMAILPSADSMLLVLQEGHPSGPIDEEGTMAACESLGLSCAAEYVSSGEELRQVVAENAGDYSAVLLGNTRLTIDEASVAVDAAGETPVFAYTGRPVEQGVLAGFVADDHKLGRMLADRLVEVVVEGTPVADVPVGTDEAPILYVNMSTAQRLGVEIPFQMLSTATIIE